MATRIGGYEIEHRLGSGTHGSVWRARQPSAMDRPVALKRMRAVDQHQLERMRAEAEALVLLDHPHIVRIFDVVEDGDGIALAMQFAPGGSLEERLDRRGVLDLDTALDITIAVCDALASAHRRGLLHLDVKPANVLFTSDANALLADFGVAQWRGSTFGAGSPGFTAPEVERGEVPDERADVFAAGRLLDRMLGEHAPSEARAVITKATAPERGDRYGSAVALRDALRDIDRASTRRAEPPKRVDDEAPVLAISESTATRVFGPRPPALAAPPKTSRSARRLSVLAMAALVVTVAAGTSVARRGRDSQGVAARVAAAPAAKAPVACAARQPVSPPPAGEILLADVDGDGCEDAIIRVGNVLEVGDGRFAIGQPDDVIVLGDWDCDGKATPAAWRPGDRRAYLFSRWADTHSPLPAAREVTADRPPVGRC